MQIEDRPAYEALKRMGFTPVKALEIVLDAARGDSYASWFRDYALTGKVGSIVLR